MASLGGNTANSVVSNQNKSQGFLMDPATLSALASILGPVFQMMGGQEGQFGSTYNEGQLSTIDDINKMIKGMSGQQDITQNPTYQAGNEWIQSLFNDPEFFKSFEAPLMRQFEEETIPGLANRFASMGSGGSTGSTAFRNQLSREGSNLQTNIAAMRGGMQQQGANQALQYAQQPTSNYQNLLNYALKPTQNTYQPSSY